MHPLEHLSCRSCGIGESDIFEQHLAALQLRLIAVRRRSVNGGLAIDDGEHAITRWRQSKEQREAKR